MYDTATRAALVKQRVQKRCRREDQCAICRLSALCLALFAALVSSMGAATGHLSPVLAGMYGAMLLHENVGGYVLVEVIAFVAAVVVTVLYIHMREKTNSKRDRIV